MHQNRQKKPVSGLPLGIIDPLTVLTLGDLQLIEFVAVLGLDLRFGVADLGPDLSRRRSNAVIEIGIVVSLDLALDCRRLRPGRTLLGVPPDRCVLTSPTISLARIRSS